ncbi:hypothetical protein [Dolichospermum circinale]|uniref:hypothetical protein n=1 Tax=Dolichospermum circinale TaxID=109265 RepID=UPI00232D9A39|nr:hypothetical protein [Dolichospermum circinale]MDB9547518.1 hypothetical protein [Dolichospermum circinale CS-1031]
MNTKNPCYTIPEPSTAMYSDVKLEYPGGKLVLRFDYDRDGAIYKSGLKFIKVLAHRHFSDVLCTAWHIEGVYDTLTEIKESSWLNELKAIAIENGSDSLNVHHYMIYFDGSGCYEIIAGSWEVLPEDEGAWE